MATLKTVSEFKDSVAGLLSGIDLNNVDNLNGALERAARTLIQKADIPEASGVQNITLYSGVFDYPCDTRIFGTAINDIRPQGISRPPDNFVIKTNQEEFDRTKSYYYPSGTSSTFQYFNGQPIIRIKSPFTIQQVILDTMNSTSGWTVGGSASNLMADTSVYYQAPASLRFTLTGSSQGTLTKTLQSPNSMANYEDVGVAFLAIEIPPGATASNLTDIVLQLGSDSSNYDSVTATEGFLGAWVTGEWLLVAFDFSTATSTGTPNWSSIQYVNIAFDHTATFTNFRVGGLWVSLPSQNQILYQSAAIFLPVGSTTPLTTITANTDTIILNDPAYTLYEFEGAISVCMQTGGATGSEMIRTFNRMLNGTPNDPEDAGLYAMYRGDNPSQEIRTTGTWYSNETGYNSWS